MGVKIILFIVLVILLIIALVVGFVIINEGINDDTQDEKKNLSDNLNITEENREIYFKDINESIVIRSLSSSRVNPNQELEVSINVVVIENETYFAVEEFIPESWRVIDPSRGETSNPNRLAWYSFSELVIEDISLTYKVQAPSSKGTYTFDGVYQFEGMSNQSTTLGQTTVTVS